MEVKHPTDLTDVDTELMLNDKESTQAIKEYLNKNSVNIPNGSLITLCKLNTRDNNLKVIITHKSNQKVLVPTDVVVLKPNKK